MSQFTHEVEKMTCIAKGPNHGPAPIPEEGKWVQAKEIKDISGLTHGVGWCAPQQGACKLTLNVKDGIIEEALVETSTFVHDSSLNFRPALFVKPPIFSTLFTYLMSRESAIFFCNIVIYHLLEK